MPPPPSARRSDQRIAGDGVQDLPAEIDARSLIDQLPAIVYVADVGVDGKWHYVSSGLQAILGFSPEEWLADPGLWARQIHPDDRVRVLDREDDLVEPTVPDEYRMCHRDGATVWVRDDAALLTDAQGRARWHGVMSDITDRKLAEAELKLRAEQQAAVARLGKHALEGAEIAQLIHDALEEATRILAVEMGAVLEVASDRGTMSLRAGLGLPPPLESLRTREADRPSYFPHQLPDGVTGMIEGKEGRWGLLWLATAAERCFGPADVDFVQALANVLADAIQHHASEDDIRHQALHDPLTGLPNRVLFLDRLGHALSHAGAQVAVVLLDIDNFKLVNDSLGHSAGDELLIEIARRLKTAVRPGDTIARLSGDEFVVLLEQTPDANQAGRIAEHIVAALELPFDLGAGEHFAKASLGIAISNGENSLPASLIQDADAAMYQAKERGRGRFEFFDEAMRARTVERLSVENDLRRAIERDELRVVYQPIVSLRDGSIVSVEALLRWEHPDRGLLSPDEFIPVAEESGLIELIGRWVLDTACIQAASWHAARPDSRPLGVSVNLSVRQFTQRDLGATVASALARTGIEPSSLCLEITESVLLEEPDRVSETIRRMARHGVRFVLDDFGTGYSSLAYLSGLPIDGLKVDRSFVQALGSNKRSEAITMAIVRMAQVLSLEVIAEGVETESQVEELRDLRCELAQGFYFHRPLTAQAVSKLLDAERAGKGAHAAAGRPGPAATRARARLLEPRGPVGIGSRRLYRGSRSSPRNE
jgi:diguanylate cyclase (GGDEF)-like protein/PAS domain S-box-containing protein